MNHERLIRATIDKYSDFPQVQADMRRVLKYASSQTRMFLQPIIDNEPPKRANPVLDALRDSAYEFGTTDAFTPEVKADGVTLTKAVAAEVLRGQIGITQEVKQALDAKYAGKPEVLQYLKVMGQIILAEMEGLQPADLLRFQKEACA